MAIEIIPTLPGGKLAATVETTAYVAAAATMQFANDGQALLKVRVVSTTTNLTINGVACTHGRPLTSVIALPVNQDYVLGPFPQNEYNDGNGKVQIAFSSIVAISVMVLKHS